MDKYYVTFGQKYRHEGHPVLGFDPDLPDRVMIIWAATPSSARAAIMDLLKGKFAFIYTEGELKAEYYPKGEFTYEQLAQQGMGEVDD